MLSFEYPKFKDVGEGKTEKEEYKGIHGTVKKLEDYKETRSDNGRFSVLKVGIYAISPAKGAKVLSFAMKRY